MSKDSNTSRNVDVRVAEVLGELLVADGVNAITRRKVMRSLCAATSSNAWLWMLATRMPSQHTVTPLGTVHHEGFTPGRLGAWIAAAQESLKPLPLIKPIVNQLKSGFQFTSTQRLLLTDEKWQSNPTVRKHRLQKDFDDAIYSVHSLVNGNCSVACFFRHDGNPHYEEQEQQIAHLVLSSMSGLSSPQHSNNPSDLQFGLTRTQQVVYTLLLQGLRRAEIAETLHVAESTARDHIRAVLRQCEVRDQLDLVCQFHTGYQGKIPP